MTPGEESIKIFRKSLENRWKSMIIVEKTKKSMEINKIQMEIHENRFKIIVTSIKVK